MDDIWTEDVELAWPTDPDGNTLFVLVVEDDRPTRLLLEEIIRSRGHHVSGCESAEAARSMLAEQFFHLIILDVQLPGMSGLDLARLVRAHSFGWSYYILVGTGQSRAEDLRGILEAGADDYIAKPYRPNLLDVRLAVAEAAVKSTVVRRHLEHDLEFLANHDPLTKLSNRRRLAIFLTKANTAAQAGQKGALLYLDLDNFKIVNDTLGHESGDRLLVAVAELLQVAVRENDFLVRFGGDEFVLVLPDCSLGEATTMAEGLVEKIEDLIFGDAHRSFRVGASIGIALIDGKKDTTAILASADAACYAAKAAGRNRVVLYEEKGALDTLMVDTDWAARLRKAMQSGGLELYFQPIVSMASGVLFSHEILLRLDDHPEHELILPAAFMSSMRRSGQAARLDRYVISRAIQWLAGDSVGDFSINVAGSSLGDPSFAGFLIQSCVDWGVSPDRIIFEVTEDEVISNLAHASEFLCSLRKEGFRFAMDDFGTGMCSLNYLRSLPVDMIKIDGTFVRRLDEDPFNEAIVRAIQALAGALSIPVVAECVESRTSFDRLVSMGIQFAQGYYMGRPRAIPYAQEELDRMLSVPSVPPEDARE